ncbi:MAG: protein kinase domain-containing protein [Ardenticatenaceae bacterium]
MSRIQTGMLPQDFVLQNRYVVLRRLGQGGMGAVYEVGDQRLGNKRMALKELSASALIDPQEIKQARVAFQREAEMLARLDHLNIPQVTDFFTQNNKYYIVMELVPGETLEQYMQRQAAPCTEQQVREWGLQLCDVLAYLHRKTPPVIFRDLKPANIMRTPLGQLKLIDFGIARLFKSGKSTDTQQIGTPGYAPLEQYGHSQTDPRSDIYSLGVVLHHLLTKYNPAQSAFHLPPVRQLNPQVSRDLEQIIIKATQQKIAQRYQSINEMKYALSRGLSAQPPQSSLGNPSTSSGHRRQGGNPSTSSGHRRQRGKPQGGNRQGLPRKSPPRRENDRSSAPTRVNPKAQRAPAPAPAPLPIAKVQKQANLATDSSLRQAQGSASRKKGGFVSCLVKLTVLGFIFCIVLSGILLAVETGSISLPTSGVNPFSTPQITTRIPESNQLPKPVLLSEAPSLSDTSNLIAYTNQSSGTPLIYISKPATGETWLLPEQPNNSSLPAWAPGGTRLAFRSYERGNSQLYTINPDGSDLRQITSGAGGHDAPAWSPDGRQIAFMSKSDGIYYIYIIDSDGKNLRRVTSIPGNQDNDPKWSPNGQWIVFESGDNNRYEIYKIRADGSELTPLATEGDSNSTPAWSPDGNTIAFERRQGQTFHIWLMDADGSNQRQLTYEGTRNLRPAWSPDSQQIAFTSNRDGQVAIWITPIDRTSPPYRLSPNEGFDPAWTRQ